MKTTEYRMVEISRTGRKRIYPMKDKDKAIADAAKYERDVLGRTAAIEERTVTATPWKRIE
jgi:hypothetical protein